MLYEADICAFPSRSLFFWVADHLTLELTAHSSSLTALPYTRHHAESACYGRKDGNK